MNWTDIDKQHIWHPYSSMNSEVPVFAVDSAEGVMIKLADGRELVDGMSSWWCAIHGYNHPVLNQAIKKQLQSMSHIMFGGLTHEPANQLARKLVELTPDGLETVFFTDSGSVSVEVAMKMALQYWISKDDKSRTQFMTIRSGYHGDTFAAMSVCDPDTGMHSIFGNNVLMKQVFVDAPESAYGQPCSNQELQKLETAFEQHADSSAAFILEPVVQGAGGMRFYSPGYLLKVRQLCDQYGLLLIADEIATGFGRSGKLFACEHAGISPDIMCVGKALTGGYMTLAATLTTTVVSETISNGEPGVFMHGPTFMANPLACAVANASIDLLLSLDWQDKIMQIENWLRNGLAACQQLESVREVRVLGAIGVIELHEPVDMEQIQPAFVDAGVWIRPFGKLVYLMPPYIIDEVRLTTLTNAIFSVLDERRAA
ncbi:MAG: adenosylmethionine--8-amino-7-oxononanoate transaminase [Gammaproteobacteria bacterium]|nr:adenosylmethionine--8-amino-7-oxononanoate transaminase [Gammaproteobacteria bacterium]